MASKRTKVAINGFGRIGRTMARIILGRPDIFELVAVNDLCPASKLAKLFKRDTVMGTWPGNVNAGDDFLSIHVGGTINIVSVCSERDPSALPWGEKEIDIVIESTGIFRKKGDPSAGVPGYLSHIEAGAKKVLLTVPAKDDGIEATVVLGVNSGLITPETKSVSNASCTTNCLAPISKVLHEAFTIKHAEMLTIHAATGSQRICDMAHKDDRRARAAFANIIPTSTGAAKAIGVVIPELDKKIVGYAVRVPLLVGSLLDLIVTVEQAVTLDQINEVIRTACEGQFKGIMRYSEEEDLVSSDIVGDPYTCIYDSELTQVNGDHTFRVVCWYDNEWGYSNRAVDLMEMMS